MVYTSRKTIGTTDGKNIDPGKAFHEFFVVKVIFKTDIPKRSETVVLADGIYAVPTIATAEHIAVLITIRTGQEERDTAVLFFRSRHQVGHRQFRSQNATQIRETDQSVHRIVFRGVISERTTLGIRHFLSYHCRYEMLFFKITGIFQLVSPGVAHISGGVFIQRTVIQVIGNFPLGIDRFDPGVVFG